MIWKKKKEQRVEPQYVAISGLLQVLQSSLFFSLAVRVNYPQGLLSTLYMLRVYVCGVGNLKEKTFWLQFFNPTSNGK
jgi:hypothetical protein